jgi:transposase
MSLTSIIWIGMDVHKDTVMVAVYRDLQQEPEIVQEIANDRRKLRRFFERWSQQGHVRSCYEASGAGYGLHREITEWSHDCDVIAPSMTPVRPGEHRKHDRRDAIQLAGCIEPASSFGPCPVGRRGARS